MSIQVSAALCQNTPTVLLQLSKGKGSGGGNGRDGGRERERDRVGYERKEKTRKHRHYLKQNPTFNTHTHTLSLSLSLSHSAHIQVRSLTCGPASREWTHRGPCDCQAHTQTHPSCTVDTALHPCQQKWTTTTKSCTSTYN